MRILAYVLLTTISAVSGAAQKKAPRDYASSTSAAQMQKDACELKGLIDETAALRKGETPKEFYDLMKAENAKAQKMLEELQATHRKRHGKALDVTKCGK